MMRISNIISRTVCAMACLVPMTVALAQAQQKDLPTQADIAAKQRQVMETMGRMPAPNSGQIRLQMESNRATANAVATMNNTPLNAQSTKADFERLARPGAVQAQQRTPKYEEDLMIFVSMSMPEQMLMAYAQQAKRFNAVLMLRGFVDDKLSKTREVIMRLNKSGARWEVSPEPFKHFKIDKVPAVVLATAESGKITEEGCARPDTFTSIFGDMSILDALDKMALRAQPAIAELAKARIMADRAAGRRGE